jgi:hypothetical protein
VTVADEIAEVVADLRTGRVRNILTDDTTGVFEWAMDRLANDRGPVVDATALFRRYVIDNTKPIDMYEEFSCVAPPWTDALICFQNTFGNVWVTQTWSLDAETDPLAHQGPMWQWETTNGVDWDRVRWTVHCLVWIGGHSIGAGDDDTGARPGEWLRIKTGGPVHLQQIAVYEDGTPADIHWVELHPKFPSAELVNQLFVALGALHFMNARNVALVEPDRPRAERRRLERLGVRMHTINVFPAGASTKGGGASGGGVPLGTVRGHMAHYGPEFGKGLLFGRHAGRFWIPMHARGSKEHGEVEHDYVIRDETG